MADIEVLSVVALLQDLPEEGLVRGQVGTVVESWAPGVYEVEFSDDNGGAYAMVALKAGQLMRLHYEPANQGASSGGGHSFAPSIITVGIGGRHP
jgi:hypothetical protein